MGAAGTKPRLFSVALHGIKNLLLCPKYSILLTNRKIPETKMQIIVTENYKQMSERSAQVVTELLKKKPNAVLGLATGSTPIETYKLLIESCKKGEISFRDVSSVNLDEYVGLDAKAEQSYAYFMRENLFDSVDISLANTFIPSGDASDLTAECERYSQLLDRLPRDLQILGLGSNGHIGFNEPGTPFDGRTHVVQLTESTVRDNSRLFERVEDVPKKAVTMGIADIMQSKTILLMASGKNKAQAVYDTVKGKVTENCPASILQKHPDVIMIIDKDAASLLK